jgi:peroxiredoxin
MSRKRRVLVVIAALLAVQAAAIGIYVAVERIRGAAGSEFRVEQLRGDVRAPDILLERADGSRVSIHDLDGRVRLVHFWATWCPPCTGELPGLLATSRALADRGLALIAISMDDDWNAIRSFFDGEIPAEVYRAVEGNAHRRYDIVSLPDSYLVPRDGHLLLRYDGARDWRSAAAKAHLASRLR